MKSAEWTVPQTGGGTILEFEQLASVPFLPFGIKFQGKHNGLSLLPAGAVSFASCLRSPSSGYPLKKPFSGADENVLKQRRPTFLYQATGIVMLARILNAIYREFLSAAVPGIVHEGARR